jgi:hypothetical protein
MDDSVDACDPAAPGEPYDPCNGLAVSTYICRLVVWSDLP